VFLFPVFLVYCWSLKLGFLLNFGAGLIEEGIRRAVNGLEEKIIFAPWRLCARMKA
jgi:hypothetical protein